MKVFKSDGLRDTEKTKPYHWCPAAVHWVSDGGLGIYIRYGKFSDRIVIKESSPSHVRIQCPDRELVIVCNSHVAWGFRPMNGTYDEYVHIGPYHDHLNEQMNLPYFMVNYVAESNKAAVSVPRKNTLTDKPNTLIMADSGGYQIVQGRVEYLDPAPMVEWYNDNVDLGFSLDVPLNVFNLDYLKRQAHIQARNNRIMLAGKKESLELINILHGSSLDYLRQYNDIVNTPEIDRMAIGGLYHCFNLMGSIDTLYKLCQENDWKHIHVLGISNFLQVALMIRMRVKGLLPHLTTDSSTAMQKARLREWHTFIAPHQKVQYTLVGYKDGYRPNPKNILPCSCQVCTAIKYSDILWTVPGNIATKLFEFHNIYSLTNYFDIMIDIAQTTTTKEYKETLVSQLGTNRQGFDEAMHCLDFIDSIAQEGYDKARNKYKIFLGDGLFDSMITTSDPKSLGLLDDDEGDDNNYDQPVSNDYIESRLRLYEDAASADKVKHGKKIKTEVANTRKTKNSSGGAATKPLTKAQIVKKRKENSKDSTDA